MECRLFPTPTADMCTPYVATEPGCRFERLVWHEGRTSIVGISCKGLQATTEGYEPARIVGDRTPDRETLVTWINGQEHVSGDFRRFIARTLVVPTYAWSPEEAFVRTVIRQVVRASQAKRLYSLFIKRFGVHDGVRYGLGACSELAQASPRELEKIGLGFKARRISTGLQVISTGALRSWSQVRGIGQWSERVLAVETLRDYCHYPFEDLSGQRIEITCGVSLKRARAHSIQLAADLYVYGASFLEDSRCR